MRKKKRGGWNSPNFKRKGQGGEPRDLSACDFVFVLKKQRRTRSFPEKLKRLLVLNHKLLCARRTCVYLLSLLDTI